jgi:hypothetical protein
VVSAIGYAKLLLGAFGSSSEPETSLEGLYKPIDASKEKSREVVADCLVFEEKQL